MRFLSGPFAARGRAAADAKERRRKTRGHQTKAYVDSIRGACADAGVPNLAQEAIAANVSPEALADAIQQTTGASDRRAALRERLGLAAQASAALAATSNDRGWSEAFASAAPEHPGGGPAGSESMTAALHRAAERINSEKASEQASHQDNWDTAFEKAKR